MKKCPDCKCKLHRLKELNLWECSNCSRVFPDTDDKTIIPTKERRIPCGVKQ